MAGSIFIPLVSVFDSKGVNQARTGLAALSKSVQGLKTASMGAAASFAGIGALGFIGDVTRAARDLDRNMVGLGNVFEDLTPQMQRFSKNASAIGLSQVEASKASTFLGSVLKQSGFEMGFVADETENLVGLAADLSATYGYDLSEALTGMTALFRGEYDPIEKFGVAMKQSEVNALLAARGLNKLTGAAQRQAMAQARLDILYQRSQDAQGAYAQQSGTLFVVQTQLKAAFDNLKSSVGQAMTDPMAKFMSAFLPLMPMLEKSLIPLFENLGKLLADLGPVLAAKAENFLVLLDAVNPLITTLTNLISPLLKPLAAIFQVLSEVVKPFIPLITFLAKVIEAVLIPVVTFLSFIFMTAAKTLGALLKGLGQLFNMASVFDPMTKGLDDFIGEFDRLNGAYASTGVAYNDMTKVLSTKLPVNDIDGVTKATEKASKGIQKTTDKLTDFIESALSIQRSIINSANITGLMDESTKEIVQSITYLDGKFKVVTVSASQGASDIASNFKNRLNQIKAFYDNLTKLSKANLDSSLIQQIVSAGPEAGNATAEAILASGTEGIKGLNKTAKDIKKVAGDIGVLGASAMEKAGGKLGNGLIDGLYAQQSKMIASASSIGSKVGDALGVSASARLKQVISEAGAAGFQLTEAEKLAIDPNYKKETPKKPTQVLPNSVGGGVPRFISSFNAGLNYVGMGGGYKLTESEDIANPFAMGTEQFSKFKENQTRANDYNISINVAPGASGAQIGDALVKAIQEYERAKGKGWRTN